MALPGLFSNPFFCEYSEVITNLLRSFSSNIDNEFDFLFAVGHMTSVLKMTTSKSIPKHKTVVNLKRKQTYME